MDLYPAMYSSECVMSAKSDSAPAPYNKKSRIYGISDLYISFAKSITINFAREADLYERGCEILDSDLIRQICEAETNF